VGSEAHCQPGSYETTAKGHGHTMGCTKWKLRPSKREPVLEKEMDWQSDDDNAVDIEELDEQNSCPYYIEVFGFHPYREIIFLFLRRTVVAYYFNNSSKVQDLGELSINHRYQIIDEAFLYTPCWIGL
jgi:hypothetical protein